MKQVVSLKEDLVQKRWTDETNSMVYCFFYLIALCEWVAFFSCLNYLIGHLHLSFKNHIEFIRLRYWVCVITPLLICETNILGQNMPWVGYNNQIYISLIIEIVVYWWLNSHILFQMSYVPFLVLAHCYNY